MLRVKENGRWENHVVEDGWLVTPFFLTKKEINHRAHRNLFRGNGGIFLSLPWKNHHDPGSSTRNCLDRDPRSKLTSRRCILLVVPRSDGVVTRDPVPRPGRPGFLATMFPSLTSSLQISMNFFTCASIPNRLVDHYFNQAKFYSVWCHGLNMYYAAI